MNLLHYCIAGVCFASSVTVNFAFYILIYSNFLIWWLVVLWKVVTCGNVPLESSFQRVSRCVYTSTSLYEYRGWDSKAANPTHRCFTWGLRSSEVSTKFYYSCIHFKIVVGETLWFFRKLLKTKYSLRTCILLQFRFFHMQERFAIIISVILLKKY